MPAPAEDAESLLIAEAVEELAPPTGRRRAAALAGIALVSAAALAAVLLGGGAARRAALGVASLAEAGDDPNWGCGLVGVIPGIKRDGGTTPETQRFLDALKRSSSLGKVSFWNWNLAPQTTENGEEILTEDFIFVPEEWGMGAVNPEYVRDAGAVGFKDSNGVVCSAEMADLFLGANEPDIKGSCMGNMFGKCLAPCTPAEDASGDCPAAHLDTEANPPAVPTAEGHCNCWEFSEATGVGFWPLEGCPGSQPLPTLWDSPECAEQVLANWRETAATVTGKGYRYLTTPLIADDLEYAQKFIDAACGCDGDPQACKCTEAACGCPAFVGFHFYAFDCQPEESGGYKKFQAKLEYVASLMDQYDFLKGAIINEVGMLNCAAPSDEMPICVENSGDFPASGQQDHACPDDGLAEYITKLFQLVTNATTKDGRGVVKGFSWFNMNMAGGTYNLQLFNEDGTVNAAGQAYMESCERWGEQQRKR